MRFFRRWATQRKSAGQATVEYILSLFFSVLIFVTIYRGILAPAMTKAWQAVNTRVDTMFQGGNLHQFNTGISQ